MTPSPASEIAPAAGAVAAGAAGAVAGEKKAGRAARVPWFGIRQDLPPGRAAFLTVLSFVLPLAVWSLVSYTPFIWHPDIKLEVAADRDGFATVYTAGDHIGKDYFGEFVATVEAENRAVLAAREAGTAGEEAKRANLKIIRHLAPLAAANGILDGDAPTDADTYAAWGKLATGELAAGSPALSAENLAIVRANWRILSAASPDYDPALFPATPLLKLVPQGKSANPVFLPAPHEVLAQGYRDFARPPVDGRPTMLERFGHSLRIVFGGFLITCLLGVPLGVLCGTYAFFSKLFEPFIDFFRYMPAPAFSTLLVAIFLAHDAPKIALVVVGTFFQMVLIVAKTTRLLDRSLLDAAQTLGARPRQLLSRVVVPGILPDLYNDLRILLGWAWTWLVIAELIGVKSGLTEFIDTQGRFRHFDSVFPVIILIGVTGFLTDQVLAFLRPVLFPQTGGGRNGGQRLLARSLTYLPARLGGASA